MRGFASFFLMSLLATSACAQPKYEIEASNKSGESNQENKSADCSLHFKNSGYCISWVWESKPTSSTSGSMVFKVYRLNSFDGSPINIDVTPQPIVVLWMDSMGHGSSPTTVTRIDVGTYRTSNVFFVMPGEWQIKFQVKSNETLQDEAIDTITI